MTIWFLDAGGALVGENNTAYPAPADVMGRLSAALPAGVTRIEDVPPLGGEHWWWPAGAPGPELKPSLALVASKMVVAADGEDHAVLTGVPAGATVAIAGPYQGAFLSDGAPIEISFTMPGEHELRIAAPGSRPARLVLTAAPAGQAVAAARDGSASEPRQQVLVGQTSEAFAAELAAAVDAHFDGQTAAASGALAMQGEASAYLSGAGSARIEGLALARGVAAADVAQGILADADRFWTAQGDRERVKRRLADLIAAGTARVGIKFAIAAEGVPLPDAPAGFATFG